jgi:folate-dependent tRNA-U54 methylase TrmFO/GidA
MEKVAVIGSGSLGAELALLFAEDGVNVFLREGEEGTKELVDRATKRRCVSRLSRFGGTHTVLSSFLEPLRVLTSLISSFGSLQDAPKGLLRFPLDTTRSCQSQDARKCSSESRPR